MRGDGIFVVLVLCLSVGGTDAGGLMMDEGDSSGV